MTTARHTRAFDALLPGEKRLLTKALAEQENFGNFKVHYMVEERYARDWCEVAPLVGGPIAEVDTRDADRYRLTDYGVELAALALAEEGEAEA